MLCKKTQTVIELRKMSTYTIMGVIATAFTCVGLFLIYTLLKDESGYISVAGYTAVDWFGLGFLIVWTSFTSFASVKTLVDSWGYKIVIDSEGVRESYRLFSQRAKTICWKDIQDYGVFYNGKLKNGGEMYDMYAVYFSPHVLVAQNAYKKKLTKETIWINIPREEVQNVAENTVFPFCQQYLSFGPNTVEVVDHILF